MSIFMLMLPYSGLADSLDPEVQAELQAEAAHSSAGAPETTQKPLMPKRLQSPPATTIYFSDFEADNGGMTGSRDWVWGIYSWDGSSCDSSNYPPPAAYSGSRMWGTRLNDCYQNLGNNQGYETCINTDKSDDSVLSFTVDLTGQATATLSWWEWFDLFLVWDWAEVYVNDAVVFQHCGGNFVAPTAWEEQVVDLTPFVGGPVTISFHMMSSTVVNHAGWFIDDVQITAQGASVAAPIPTLSEWGMIIMSLILAGSAIWMMRRRQVSS